MRTILKIAKNELRHLFFSPVAWFLMIVFTVQCAMLYMNVIEVLANWQETLKNSPGFKGFDKPITYSLFIEAGLFGNITTNLYLFVPLLTMGLMSREVNSGSVKLLYSSPIKIRQIVLGKYIGVMLLNILFVLILGIFSVVAYFNIQHMDYGMLLSALLGFYLLLCTYTAIGLFVSTLSNYQILSALSTFIVVFMLGYIGSVWQQYDFVRELTYFLSLQNRTTKLLTGLIVSRDVIYFLIISCMFLAFAMLRLRSGREKKPWYIRLGRYATVMAVTLAIGYVTSRSGVTGYIDATASQRNTIPKEMQHILKEMGDSTLEVTLYTNLLGSGIERGLPQTRNTDYLYMWDYYVRFKPDVKFKYVYYYDTDAKGTDSAVYKQFRGKPLKQIAGEVADVIDADLSDYQTPEQIRKLINLQPEMNRLVMQVKYNGRTEFLRTYPPPDEYFWPNLTNVSATFKRLMHPEKVPRIYFTTGALERSISKTGEREHSDLTANKLTRTSLVNIGFDVDTLNLETQNIPDNCGSLVLADPKTALSPTVQTKLKSYIAEGGNLVVMGEPGKQDVLNPLLKHLGVQLMNGQLVQPSYDETPDKVTPYITATGSYLWDELSWIKRSLEVNKDTVGIQMTGVTGLSYSNDSGFTVKPLLMTYPEKSWLKAGGLVADSTLPAFNAAAGDLKQSSFPAAVQLTRQIDQKEQRIVVFGDADGAGNRGITYPNIAALLIAMHSWMSYNEFPVSMSQIKPKDLFLNITADGAKKQRTMLVWVLPGLVLALGSVLLIRRKRK